ncbi:MAG TPA: hypothetical protein VLA98_08460 [Solirubrobacteraceae bacterium]|nr:hypothetical protein [Solirubrobacteraceae bacterium]
MRRIALVLVAVLAAAAVAVAVAGATGHQGRAAAAHPSLQLRKTKLGRIVVDARSRTLYLFEKDRRGRSACYGACAGAWPPALAGGRVTVGRGLSARRAGTTRRRDGKRQLTYGGHPLYRFAPDANRPGSTKGQGVDGFGAKWYVVASSGRKIDKD